jgi:hypothetical protein
MVRKGSIYLFVDLAAFPGPSSCFKYKFATGPFEHDDDVQMFLPAFFVYTALT